MIYIGCGVIMFVIGVIWLIAPSPNPNRIYGYMSYLASVNEAAKHGISKENWLADKIQQASVEELLDVPGMNRQAAEAVYEFFRKPACQTT